MRDAVICEPLRTPVGRFGGVFKDVPAHELGALVVTRAGRQRTGIDPGAVDDVIFAHCYPSMDAPALGRVVGARRRPAGVGRRDAARPAVRLRAAGGHQRARCRSPPGASDVVIAGGAESMSTGAALHPRRPVGTARRRAASCTTRSARGRVTAGGINHPVPGGMLETAENLRRQYGIPRAEQDEFALRSHQRAVAAQQDRDLQGGDRPGDRARPARRDRGGRRRAPPGRHLAGVAGRAAPGAGPRRTQRRP